MTARLDAMPLVLSESYEAAVAGSARSIPCASISWPCWYFRPSIGFALSYSTIACTDLAPPGFVSARYAFRSRLNSRVVMPAGFGLGVAGVTTIVVAPAACSALTTVGYGAVVLLITAIFLP